MKKYQPITLPKHGLTSKLDKKPFEFSYESAIGVLLGPISLIYLNVWFAFGLAIIDMIAIVIIHFLISNAFLSPTLIIVALVLLIANHYLCAWLRQLLIERRR